MWTTVFTVGLKFVGFFAALIVISHLSVYEYGLMELILSGIAIFGICALPGLANVIIADMSIERGAGNLGRAKAILNNYILVQAIFGLIAWACIFFGSRFIAELYNANIGLYFKILSFTFLLSPLRSAYGVLFSVYFKFFAKNFLTFAEEVLKLILLAVFVLTLDKGVGGVMWATLLSQLGAILVMTPVFLKLKRELGTNPGKPLPLFYFITSHGKWGIGSTYINSVGQNLRLWLIKLFLGTEAVGLFSLALSLINHTFSLITLSSVLSPIISQFVNEKERFKRIIAKGIKYQFITFVVIAIIGYICFPTILAAFFPKYVESIPLFKIMLLAAVPLSFAAIFTPMFYAIKAQRDLFVSIAIKTLVIAIVSPIMMHFFGMKGIAFEFLITISLYVIERYYRLRRLLPEFNINFRSMVTADDEDAVILKGFMKPILKYVPFLKR